MIPGRGHAGRALVQRLTAGPRRDVRTSARTGDEVFSEGATSMEYEPDELDINDRYDDEVFFRTCGKCGARTAPRWSESACLEEARRYGWRRVAASDRPGARRLDLCGVCAEEAGFGPPLARWG